MTEDIDFDAPVQMTKREALEQAQGRISNIVANCLDLGLMPDKLDCQRLREANDFLALALRRK